MNGTTATGRGAEGAAPVPRETILVVEDHEDYRSVYATYLAHVGYTVVTARNAEEGLGMTRQRRPDLILMDIDLPGMDGNAATRILKSDPTTRDIPVLVLTVHAFAEDRARALGAGCDRFLTKPLELRVLEVEVRRLLACAGTSPTREGGPAAPTADENPPDA